jgi:gliding motility-associated-like protein
MARKTAHKTFFLALYLLFYGQLYAQRGNIWHFGQGAGVNFNVSPPRALTNSFFSPQEGCSVICDNSGDLLFYSDGARVFNRLHQLMPNGTGLLGNPSTYQSCIIIPHPGNPQLYYIFSADAYENFGEKGYHYSIVDMSAAGGLGDVTTKNMFLYGSSSERITAVKAANGIDYWVITNEWSNNNYRVYKVDCNGLNTTPVVSVLGNPLATSDFANIGSLRASADGKLLCRTNSRGRFVSTPVDEFAELFDFNNTTGVLSNARELPVLNDGYYINAEFSPDSKLLYLVNPFSGTVHQFDISSGNIAAILATKYVLPINTGFINGIQMGPDRRIYLTSNAAKLHVINNPDVAGAGCSLVLNQLDLAGRESRIALPNLVPNFFAAKAVDFTYTVLDTCAGRVQFFGNINLAGVSFEWDFGDGTRSTVLNPVHSFANPSDNYTVKLKISVIGTCGTETATKNVNPGGFSLKAGFGVKPVCELRQVTCTDSSSTDAGSGFIYNWDFGDGNTDNTQNPVHTYTLAGSYTITLTIRAIGKATCIVSSYAVPVELKPPVIKAGGDLFVDAGGTQLLSVTGAVDYSWSPGTYLDDSLIADPVCTPLKNIQYIITGTNAAGCTGKDTLNIEVSKLTYIELPNGFTPNNDTRNNLFRPLLRGIRQVDYFIVVNRWGQRIFYTNIRNEGWDGRWKGIPQPAGTYLWMAQAVDVTGKIIRKRGVVTLIR